MGNLVEYLCNKYQKEYYDNFKNKEKKGNKLNEEKKVPILYYLNKAIIKI